MVCCLAFVTSCLFFDCFKLRKKQMYCILALVCGGSQKGGLLNWHRGMAKHFKIVSLLLCHPMKDSWWVVYFEPVLMELGSPFCRGSGSCSTKGVTRHFFLLSAALPPPIMNAWLWQSMCLSLFQAVYR